MSHPRPASTQGGQSRLHDKSEHSTNHRTFDDDDDFFEWFDDDWNDDDDFFEIFDDIF